MDCKHESLMIDEVGFMGFGVCCNDCGEDVSGYVIITKERVQLMQDVIEAAQKMVEREHIVDDTGTPIYYDVDYGDIVIALEAYEAL